MRLELDANFLGIGREAGTTQAEQAPAKAEFTALFSLPEWRPITNMMDEQHIWRSRCFYNRGPASKLAVKCAVLASFQSNPLIAITSPSEASREGDA